MSKRFSIVEAIRFSFSTIIEHFPFFLLLFLAKAGAIAIFLLLVLICCLSFSLLYWHGFPLVTHFINTLVSGENAQAFMQKIFATMSTGELIVSFLAALFCFLGFFLFVTYLWLGSIRVSLDFYDKGESSIARFFSCYDLILKGAGAMFLYILMVTIGTIFFVIPGLYIATKYAFYSNFIVDQEVGVFESFGKSAALTKGARWKIFSVIVLLRIIQSVFGVLTFWLSNILITIVEALVMAFIYRKLMETQLPQ